MLTRDGFGLTGGPAPVTLPTAPVVTAPTSPLPTPLLPSPPSPVLPTPGIETADAFEFGDMVLGNPGSPEEALALLGLQSGPTSGSGGISRGGATTVFYFDEGSVTFYDFPAPSGGAFKEQYYDDVRDCLDMLGPGLDSREGFEYCAGF
jgi:hypothetical protein